MNYLLYFCLIINDNCIFFSDKTAKSTLNELLVNVIETELANLYKSTESVEQLNENFLHGLLSFFKNLMRFRKK